MASSREGAGALRFTRPTQQIVLMVIILALVIAGGVLVWPRVEDVFLTSPYLNGTIGVVFVVGVCATFFQVIQLFSSVAWIEEVAGAGQADNLDTPPRLLAAMTGVARMRGSRMQITPASAKSVLDSVGTRMEESRDITRYIANLLIFLGLLGTFFGLATTVPAVVETIRSLQPTEGEEGLAVFGRLMDGLDDQLGGMGTAFASSLLGLAGSLIVGLLELYAGHGQNRFYRELEEWLASITRVSFSGDGDGAIDKAAIATVLDHMVDQMDTLQSLFAQSETRRAATEQRMLSLSQSVEALTERLGPGQAEVTERLARAQDRLASALDGMAAEQGLDDESRNRLRSIDVQLFKLAEELGTTRDAEVMGLRGDMAQLTEALQALTQAARAPAAARASRRPTDS
ncbi:biopolymer transporter ExbB [Hasllibacter sp. MH4015]|uniref:biopolymer transporter ExbB n=1 Tax=Hasllibacter sp. MH4015 TaxID=2854029 RepID=UPI001CD5E74A|nr:biopolymer transporter ExbB [Hasllibacter sp. MH4015]